MTSPNRDRLPGHTTFDVRTPSGVPVRSTPLTLMLDARLRPRSDRIADRQRKDVDGCGVQVAGKSFAQQQARTEEPTADGRRRNGKTLSGFLDGHVLDFTHDEDGAEGDRKLVNSPLEHAADFCSQRGVGRRLPFLVRQLHWLIASSCWSAAARTARPLARASASSAGPAPG